MTTLSSAVLLSIAWLGSAMQAQTLEEHDPFGSIRLRGGGSTGQIRLQVSEAPSSGDYIEFNTNSPRLHVVLITPRGQRVTAENAALQGFKWHENNPFVSDGHWNGYTNITFMRPGVAGPYTLQVTDASLRTPATATAWFRRVIQTLQGYRQFVRSISWAQMPDSVPIAPSGALRFGLGLASDALFDVVVPDSKVKVTLKLPGGKEFRQDLTGQDGATWSTVSYGGRPTEPDPNLGVFGGLIMPVAGYHHLIYLPKAAKGEYEVRASQAGKTIGKLSAVYLPYSGIFDNSLPPPPGRVRIRRGSKEYETSAGEQLDLRVGLLGDVGPTPPVFRVRMEYTPEGAAVPNPIESVPVTFTRGLDGDYHGLVVFPKAGYARIEVSAKGETASGQSFAELAIFGARIHQVVARILSVDAKAVDLDGDHKFDRLDVTTSLDVIVPGEYTETIYVTDAKQRKVGGLIGIGSATLRPGRQSLTNRISGWRIWNELPDSPYEVHLEQLFLAPGRLVRGVERWSHVVTEPRDAWDHGPTYGEDHAVIHGILPAPSGRFRLAEVEWEVTTPGGHCSWGGSLAAVGAPVLSAGRSAEIPAGRHKVSFFFDGAAIAQVGAHQWMLSAGVECGGTTGRGTLVGRTVNLDADLFQPQNPAFLFSGQENFVGEGGRWSAHLYANNYLGRLGTHISLTEVPKELDAQLTRVFESGTRADAELSVLVSATASPGRYFIELAASSGSETVTRYIAVDISSLDVERGKK